MPASAIQFPQRLAWWWWGRSYTMSCGLKYIKLQNYSCVILYTRITVRVFCCTLELHYVLLLYSTLELQCVVFLHSTQNYSMCYFYTQVFQYVLFLYSRITVCKYVMCYFLYSRITVRERALWNYKIYKKNCSHRRKIKDRREGKDCRCCLQDGIDSITCRTSHFLTG